MAQIPRVAEIIGPGIDKLRETLPKAFPYVNNGAGRWADLYEGWGAQCAVVISRLADEAVQARLPLSTGDGLTALASSEYTTERSTTETAAVGSVTLYRPSPTSGGVIRKGFRFRRLADDSTIPRVQAALYVATRDVPWPNGVTSISVPCVADRTGIDANSPTFSGDNAFAGKALPQLADTPFDPAITVTGYEMAGGSTAETDDELRRAALAYATGQFAPVQAAILAGSLRDTGVHHVAIKDVVNYVAGGVSVPGAFTAVNVADESWASGATWVARVQQTIADTFLGHGCVVKVQGVDNKLIRATFTVVLKDTRYLSDTSDITANIQKAVRSYFDDRSDWYTWRLSQLRAVVSHADPKIQTCSLATVYGLSDGATLAEPTTPSPTSSGYALTHYNLVDNGVICTFVSPQ